MSDNLKLEMRVSAHDDASPVIAKVLASIKKLQDAASKLGSKPTKAMADDLARVSATADKAAQSVARSQTAAMRSLRQRFTFEARMNRQQAKEEAAAEKVRQSVESQVLADLKTRLRFSSQRSRQEAADARAVARAEVSAARETARAWKEARREAAKGWERGKDAAGRIVRPLAATAAAGAAGTASLVRRSLRAEGDIDGAEVNARIYGGLSKDAARKLRDDWAAPLAEQLGIGTDKLLTSYVDALKLGIPAAGAQAFAGLATKASAAWEVPFQAVSDILGTVNQVLTSTGAAFDIDKIKSVANAIQYLAAKQSTTPEKLMSFLQRGAGAAQILGMSQEAGLAFGSASTSLGNQAGQSGRMFDYVASRLVELPKLTRKHGDEGRQARQMLQALGYSGAEDVERRRRADPDGFMEDFMTRFSKIRDPKKQDQALRFFAGREWFGEFGRMVKGIDTYKEAVKLQKEAKKFDAIGEVWELHKQKLSFVFKQFTAGWTNILGEFGKELSPLARQAGDFFLGWTSELRKGGLSARFKAALEGFIEGLGFKSFPALLERIFGKPGEGNAGSIKAWGDAFRGFGQGLRDVATTIRGFFSVFTGKDATPETIGRWTGRILAFAAACVIAAPAISLLGGMGTAILAFAAIVKGASATLRALGLIGGSTAATGAGAGAAGAGTAGTAAAAGGGVLARILGWLKFAPAVAMPLTTDASKADQDRLMGRLGAWAQEQEKAQQEQRKAWVDPPARVQRQSGSEDWRSLVSPIGYRSDEIARGVDRTARAVERLGAKLELASLSSGGLSGGSVARAAVGSAPASAAGLGYTPGAGGAALYGSRPGSKLPGFGSGQRFGGRGGGGSSSPAAEGSSDPIPGTLNPRLAGSRKSLMDELDRDPGLRRDVLKTASMENRGSPLKMQTVLESMVNRAKMNGYTSLRQAIHSGFYGPVNRGGLRGALSEKDRLDGEAALKQVRNGSNVIGYRTDQGMLTDPGARKYMREPDHSGHRVIGGENYFYMGQKGRAWAKRQEALDAASGKQGPAEAAKEALGGKPGTYSSAQDMGDGIKGKPFQSASDLAKTSPAEALAKKAPPQGGGAGVGGQGPSIHAPISLHGVTDPEKAAQAVSRHLNDAMKYRTTDYGIKSI